MKIFSSTLLLALALSTVSAQQTKPVLTFEDINGRTFSLSDFKSKVVLLNFWATWCQPCRAEIPDLIAWQKQYEHDGLQIVGITYPPETLSEVKDFARELGMSYPIALGTKEARAFFTSRETLPMTIVLDRQGVVRDVVEGIMYADEFDKKVRPLLFKEKPNRAQPPPTRKQVKATTATILIGDHGYQPSKVSLRQGIPARLTFIRKTEQTCGTEIVIPAYKINRPLPLNVPVVVRFTPRKSGRYKFTCGMDMFRGALVVK
jgi:thiol-disulfide isomerase/thioredoxin